MERKRIKIVIHPAIESERLAAVEARVEGEVVNAESDAEAIAAMAGAEGFFGKMTPSLLKAANRLRWVQSPTASLEHYLFPELVEHPCVLTNMRGIFNDVIADHVMGYILCFARNLHLYIHRQSEARWEPIGGESARQSFTVGPGVMSSMDRAVVHLAGATLGIIGLGGIGRELARRADAFGMRLLGVDPQPSFPHAAPDLPRSLEEVWPPERLPDLLAASDFVAIAAPHTPETYKLFRREQFQMMKRKAFLINIGRGVIVDLTDLTAALKAGEIAGAALDVFEEEPLPSDHALWRMRNVIVTPHVAACSPRITERHRAVLLKNIERFQKGEPLLNVVDKRKWY